MINIDELISQYYRWLKSRTELFTDPETGWTQISTPFTGLFNDAIEIYAKANNGRIILSDDGQTLHNLDLVGASATRSPRRKELLDKVLLNYGILLVKDTELQVEATEKEFPQKKHNLLSAISEISDMFMLAKPTVASIFKEDVQIYLEEQDIVYTPQFIARGATGIEFTFDFHIAYRKKEIVLKAFNRLNTFNLPHFLFAWEDIKDAREKLTEKTIAGLAVINDAEKPVKEELLEAIRYKQAEYFLWSQRHQPETRQKLAA